MRPPRTFSRLMAKAAQVAMNSVITPTAAAPAGTAPVEDEPVDPGLLAALERLMTVDRLYRQEGLTIGVLAGKLGLPQAAPGTQLSQVPSCKQALS